MRKSMKSNRWRIERRKYDNRKTDGYAAGYRDAFQEIDKALDILVGGLALGYDDGAVGKLSKIETLVREFSVLRGHTGNGDDDINDTPVMKVLNEEGIDNAEKARRLLAREGEEVIASRGDKLIRSGYILNELQNAWAECGGDCNRFHDHMEKAVLAVPDTFSENDLIEMEDRFGPSVRRVVEDIISGKERRWEVPASAMPGPHDKRWIPVKDRLPD